MSREAQLIKRLVLAMKEIALLSEVEISSEERMQTLYLGTGDGKFDSIEVTLDVKSGLGYAANIAKNALEGVIV